jgi:multiple sugar transport system permease protein
VLSFTDYDIYAITNPSNARFVGFNNYVQAFQNPVFWQALRNTFFYVLVGGPLSVITSLAVALLVHSKRARFPALFRTVYFSPVIMTLVAVSIVWRYLYHPRYGLVDFALAKLGIAPIDWLGDPHWAMPAIIVFAVWKNFGYNMLIFVAGLQNVPEEQYEAATLDGASSWARFLHVTVPNLAPTFLFVGVLTMVGHFQLFSESYVMTAGGPLKATTSVLLLMYEEGFRWWRMGTAAAIAFILFLFMLAGTLVQMRLQRERA